MRRGGFQTRGNTGTPVSVGNTGTFTTTNGLLTQRTLVNTSDPASATSNVVTVTMHVAAAGTFYVHVGSLAGTTYTVRSVSSSSVRATGLHTFSVSLAVVAGDYIGVTSLDGGQLGVETGASGETIGSNTVASTPVPAATLTLANTNSVRLAILGTNP